MMSQTKLYHPNSKKGKDETHIRVELVARPVKA